MSVPRKLAHHADLGRRHQIEHAVEHAQASAQNGHHGDFLALDALHTDVAAPAIDGHRLQREVAGGFVSQQPRQLMGQGAEFIGADLGFAQQAEFVLHQRVVDDGDRHDSPQSGSTSAGGRALKKRSLMMDLRRPRQRWLTRHKRLDCTPDKTGFAMAGGAKSGKPARQPATGARQWRAGSLPATVKAACRMPNRHP